MITIVVELLFAVTFVRTLIGYLRRRDPLQRDIMLIFVAAAVLFVVDLIRRFVGYLPTPVAAATTSLLLLQPYLTLRLAAQIRRVPRWLALATLAAFVGSALPIALAPRPLSPGFLVLLVISFVTPEAVAAVLLAGEARRRTGAARVRLRIAAWATAASALALTILGLAPVLGLAGPWVSPTGRSIALVSAVGYLAAFMPPGWLRRIWSATAWYNVGEQLRRSPAMATANQVWQRYVEVVRGAVGTDAVVLIRGTEPAGLTELASVGVDAGTPVHVQPGHLAQLVSVRQPIRVRSQRHRGYRRASDSVPALAAHYGHSAQARFVTALALPLSHGEGAVLMLLSRRRALFTDDDLRLVTLLGEQAAVLAERGEVLAEQQELSRRLAESVDALTHASKAKSDFLAGMSHELRTPLNAIIGFSDLMRAEDPQGDIRRVPAEWVEHIHSSGRHLLRLINDILDLAKVEAGRLELHTQPLPLDAATAEVITVLGPLTDSKRLSVFVRVPRLGAHVDPLRFRQILDNLLSNAIKFTPDGGHISVSAARVGDEVAITVADTGVGIAPADQDSVFEEFRQVGEVGQRTAGTGLGLPLARRLVEAHGGSLTLESTLGAGSRFTVRLPDATAELPDEPAAGAEPVDLSLSGLVRGRVLIIDDDARSAQLLRTCLTGAGYEVDTATSGEAGIVAARSRCPDAVLLDVVLPGIDGREVIRGLKGDPATQHVPVFFHTIIDDRRAGLSLGATDYFVKPIDHTALLAALARHLPPVDAARALSTAPLLVTAGADGTR